MEKDTKVMQPENAVQALQKDSSTDHVGAGDDAISPTAQDEDYKALSETMPMWAVVLVVLGILMSLFLVALDRTIVSTVSLPGPKPQASFHLVNSSHAIEQAIPEITNEFHSLDDYGWYGSAYLLSCCAVQLLFGKLFAFFSVKHTLLLSVLTFEVASAICGAAPDSNTLIAGRTIAGLGAAGIFTGAVGWPGYSWKEALLMVFSVDFDDPCGTAAP